jgi:hypothetical protein
MKKFFSNVSRIAVCLLIVLLTAYTASSQTYYYYNGSGAFTSTASWGLNNNGTGGNPADFTTANQIFIIQNATNITHNSGNFTVTGTGSKIVMGNPTYATPGTASSAITITIAAGSQITSSGNVNFEVSQPSSGNHKIIYQNTSAISFSTAINDPNLELVFDGCTLTTTTNRTFGNVSLINNANVTMALASIVVNNLTVNEGSTLAGPLDASGNYIAIKTGGSVTINGTLRVGRQGSVTSPAVGGLYTTGVALPVVAATTQATLLFQSSTTPPALTLGPNSTVDYYRGFGATQTGVQGITPWAYANLTLSNDATASNRSFAVAGNVTVAKTFTINLASGATITQPSSTTNVTLLPGARLVINSATAFPTNGKLTLQSDATGTASIGTLATGASITGNVTVQQFIPSGFRKYRFLSHPFTTAQALSQLTDNIDITGTGGSTNGFTTTSTNNPSAFSFTTANADGGSPTDAGWAAFTSATTSSWAQGQGIRVLVRGTKGQTGTLDGTNASPNAVTLDMSGVINTGNVSVNLVTGGSNATAGFNLVGNPYPSPVDIGAVLTAAGSNVGSSFYLRNPQTGSYITVPVASSYIIPGGTAFFVKANAPSTLAFAETNKSTCTSCATVFRNSSLQNRLQIKAFQNNLEYDNLYINLGKYSNAYEEANDAIKLTNDALSIYVLSSDKQKLASDYRSVEDKDIIPLGIALPANLGVQTYVLKVSDVQMDAQTTLILFDKLNNTYTTLKEGATYSLQVDPSNPSSIGDKRLQIIISKKAITPILGATSLNEGIEILATAEAITIVNNTTTSLKNTGLSLINLEGQSLLSQSLNLSAGEKISIAAKQFASGLYVVQIQNADTKLSKKVFKP